MVIVKKFRWFTHTVAAKFYTRFGESGACVCDWSKSTRRADFALGIEPSDGIGRRTYTWSVTGVPEFTVDHLILGLSGGLQVNRDAAEQIGKEEVAVLAETLLQAYLIAIQNGY